MKPSICDPTGWRRHFAKQQLQNRQRYERKPSLYDPEKWRELRRAMINTEGKL